MPRLEGTAMKELVEEGRLRRADILLSRTKRSLLGSLIRFGTDSYWNHTLMIYAIRSPRQGYETTFIIESGGSGIDIHNIAHYFEKPWKYDVAVKRLETDWFQDNEENGGLRYRRRVRGFALREIDDKYDHRLILTIARRFLRQLVLALLFPWQRLKKDPNQRRVQVSRVIGLDINAYICSGFVQWAYYQAVGKILQEDGLDESRLQDVIFNPRLTGGVTEEKLLATTPADLANSSGLSWKYVVKNGVVWDVAGSEEVDQIVGSR
ncbi:MAG: hypothetical protein E3J30_11930 [Anaerolineales bacterium]|nr:MAG: hypothetical protein E3J30_11930 [Anaerolineales bacterium]